MRRYCRTLALLTVAVVAAQAKEPALETSLERLRVAALESPFALAQVEYLADVVGPRLTGSPQAAAAVRYVAATMEAQGFRVRKHEVKVPHWVRGDERARVVEWAGKDGDYSHELVLTTLGGSVATPPEGLVAEVVVVKSFAALTALGRERIEGRIVLFDVVFDQRMAHQGRSGDAYSGAVAYRSMGAVAAAKLGAVASLIRSVGGVEYRLPHTGVMRYEDGVKKIPHAALAAEDSSRLARLAARGPVKLHLTLTPETKPDAISYNVVADLVGSEFPDEVVLVSGHLDSWDLGTGAIDDAAGVASAMATLKLVKDLGIRPKRTLRMVAWMNEENGMRGVQAYVKDYADTLGKHRAAIEADFGVGHPIGFVTHSPEAMRKALAPVLAVTARSGARLLDSRPSPVSSDISHLGAAGVATFAPLADTRTYFDYHHTAADTFDKIDPKEFAENVAAMAVLALGLSEVEVPEAE